MDNKLLLHVILYAKGGELVVDEIEMEIETDRPSEIKELFKKELKEFADKEFVLFPSTIYSFLKKFCERYGTMPQFGENVVTAEVTMDGEMI